MKVFVFDSAICNGCYNCQLACKDENVDNEWLPYSLRQPDLGHFWCGLEETIHGQIPKVKLEYRMQTCHQCDAAPCMDFAPDAIYKRSDGIVIIDPVMAKGRRDILDACPYNAIWWNAEAKVPQKCTGCAHLLDEGKLPHCVDLCPTEAWSIGEEDEMRDRLEGAVPLSDVKHQGRVYYRNLPGLFIGGEVWDPEANVVIEEAAVELLDVSGGKIAMTTTDGFGDFWFRRLDPGDYEVSISAEGFVTVMAEIRLEKSLNIGDFPLVRI